MKAAPAHRSRSLAWLRVTRVPLAPTAVCDSLACGLLAHQWMFTQPGDVPLWRWACVAGCSLLLYLSGMACNDLADVEKDRTINPDRPLPQGVLRPVSVLLGYVLLTAGAAWLAVLADTVLAAATASVAALLYNVACRRPWWLGALMMGTVRFANASLLVAPFVMAKTLSPVAFMGPACIGLYATAVTIWSTTEERVAPQRIVAARILIAIAALGAGVTAWLAAGFTIGMVVGAGIASSTLFGRTPRTKHSPKGQVLELLLGLYFIAAVLATAAWDGALLAGVGALVLAWLSALGSQLLVRSLGRKARRELRALQRVPEGRFHAY